MPHRWHIREESREAECEAALVKYVHTADGSVRVHLITPRMIDGKDEAWAILVAQDAEAAIQRHLQADSR